MPWNDFSYFFLQKLTRHHPARHFLESVAHIVPNIVSLLYIFKHFDMSY